MRILKTLAFEQLVVLAVIVNQFCNNDQVNQNYLTLSAVYIFDAFVYDRPPQHNSDMIGVTERQLGWGETGKGPILASGCGKKVCESTFNSKVASITQCWTWHGHFSDEVFAFYMSCLFIAANSGDLRRLEAIAILCIITIQESLPIILSSENSSF